MAKVTNAEKEYQDLIDSIAKMLPNNEAKSMFNSYVIKDHPSVESLTQTKYVVEYLHTNGIMYNITSTTAKAKIPNSNNTESYNQLMAELSSPKAKITLTGKGNHIPFIGSTMKDGNAHKLSVKTYDQTAHIVLDAEAYVPSQSDLNAMYDVLLKANADKFIPAEQSHKIGRTDIQKANTAYINGALHKTLKCEEDVKNPNYVREVDFVTQSTTATQSANDSIGQSAITIASSVKSARDYLINAIEEHSKFILNNTTDEDIASIDVDNSDIADMIADIRKMCTDTSHPYNLELAESSNVIDTLHDIITEYIDTNILKLNKDANLNTIDAASVLSEKAENITADSINKAFTGFTMDPLAVIEWSSISENEGKVATKHKIEQAIYHCGLNSNNIVGDDNRDDDIADGCVKFNEATAKTKDDFDADSFEYKMLANTEEYLSQIGVKDAVCRYDENGLVDIVGKATSVKSNKSRDINVHAVMGPLLAPDDRGAIYVHREKSGDYLFVPGMTAFVEPDDGTNKPFEQRIVVTSYDETVKRSIASFCDRLAGQIGASSTATVPNDVDVMYPTIFSSLYSETYGTRFNKDMLDLFEKNYSRDGLSKDECKREANMMLDALIHDVYSRAMKFPKEFGDKASTIESLSTKNEKNALYNLVGHNVRVFSEDALKHYAYPLTAPGKNFGLKWFIKNSTDIDATGHLIPGDETDTMPSAFENFDALRYMKYNPLDRNVMTLSALTTALGIKQTKTAYILMNAWGLGDGVVVSKDFAESVFVPDENSGELRHLKIGDKQTDPNGNKGVINYIVDPNMTDDDIVKECEKYTRGLDSKRKELMHSQMRRLRDLFKLNPELQMIAPPCSGQSRSNAGTAMAGLNHDKSDLIIPNADGSVGSIPNAVVTSYCIITDKTVDSKTHTSDDEFDEAINSSMLQTAVLSANGCNAAIKEVYENNENGLAAVKANLSILGISLQKDGTMCDNLVPDDRTAVFTKEAPHDAMRASKTYIKQWDDSFYAVDSKGNLHNKESKAKWKNIAKDCNGLIQLPCCVYGPADDNGERRRLTAKVNGKSIYVLPVIANKFRSSIKNDDGEVYSHDYTQNYNAIIKNASKYTLAMNKLVDFLYNKANAHNTPIKSDFKASAKEYFMTEMQSGSEIAKTMNAIFKTLNATEVEEMNLYRDSMKESGSAVASAYEQIVNDVETNQINNKKKGIVSSCLVKTGMKYSGQAPITADPRLSANKVAVPRSLYESITCKPLGSKPKEGLLMQRHPMLHTRSAIYIKPENIIIDDNLTGIALPPYLAKMLDGDNDGDTFGCKSFKNKDAIEQLSNKLTINKLILDTRVGEVGNYPLSIDDSVDIKAGIAKNPKLGDSLEKLRIKANEEYAKNHEVSDDTIDKISDVYSDIMALSTFENALNFTNASTLFESMAKSTKEYGNGAKGTASKVKDFAKRMDYDIEFDDSGRVTKCEQNPLTIDDVIKNTENESIATACKVDLTGVAGAQTQKGISAFIGIDTDQMIADIFDNDKAKDMLKASGISKSQLSADIMNITYLLTQMMLQAKHDAKDAVFKANGVGVAMPCIFNGKRVDVNPDNTFKATNASLTKAEWIEQFKMIACALAKIDTSEYTQIINADGLERVATVMELFGEKGKVASLNQIASKTAPPICVSIYGDPNTAYTNKTTPINSLRRMAERGDNIYEGLNDMAPKSIDKAQNAPNKISAVLKGVIQATNDVTKKQLREVFGQFVDEKMSAISTPGIA